MWKVIRNVLTGRERREVQVALQVLSDSVVRLQNADNELTAEERELAEYYLERLTDLTAFFQFAQIALESILGSDESIGFESLTKLELT